MPNQAKTSSSLGFSREKGGFFSSPYGTPPPPIPTPTTAPPARPRCSVADWLAGMAGQIAEACLAVTSQRVPHKFSPAALRAS